MIEYIYEFEGHDLTKEVVMVMVRDDDDDKWSGPLQLGAVIKNGNDSYFVANLTIWNQAKLAPQDEYLPWTMETAEPVMLRSKETGAKVWMNYGPEVAWYACRGHFVYNYVELLEEFEQLDGTPAGTKV